MQPSRVPWAIYVIAVCDLLPVLAIGILLAYLLHGASMAWVLAIVAFPLLMSGLNLWALCRPHRITRWFPIVTPLIGIVAIILRNCFQRLWSRMAPRFSWLARRSSWSVSS